MKFVIAGNYKEYEDWCKELITRPVFDPSERYHYVSGVDTIRGYQDPHGFFIGSWMQRPDIADIIQQLLIATKTDNRGLTNALLMLTKK